MATFDRIRDHMAPSGRRGAGGGPELRRDEQGASAVEYGLLIAAVAVFFIAALVLIDMFGAVFEAGACDTDRGYTCTTT